MDNEHRDVLIPRLGAWASQVFVRIEIVTYMVLGVLLALAALVGIGGAGVTLWGALLGRGNQDLLVLAIDRLLFVLMVIEILHTVRVSFRSGTLVCEPFLVVGLIASIRRVLVITLESSQANQPGNWTDASASILHASMLELSVLGGLIVVMVLSIFLLRRSDQRRTARAS
jgi:uncharacterized membrane protein (DUF373 family)